MGSERRIGRQISELLAINDITYPIAGHVRLEVGFDGRDGRWRFWDSVCNELRKLFLQQLILGLEARDKTEDLLQDFAEGQTTIHSGGFAQFIESVILLRLVEDSRFT